METDKNEDDEKKKKGIHKHTHTHAYTLFGFPCFMETFHRYNDFHTVKTVFSIPFATKYFWIFINLILHDLQYKLISSCNHEYMND